MIVANFDLIEYQKRVIDDLTAENKALKEQIDELALDGNKIVCELYNLKENHEKTQQLLSAAMEYIPKNCDTCKYGKSPCDWCWNDPDGTDNWEWKGVDGK